MTSTGKKRRPVMIGKLLTTGQRSSTAELSPRSPLELQIVSPRGVVMNGGVGLGIAAGLDIEDDEEYTIVTRHMPNNNSYRKVYDGKGKSRCALDKGDFLSCCHECNKRLDGRDVYMYRGETPFCSIECRGWAISIMEQQEEEERSCSSPPSHVVFSGGIFAI